VNPTASTPTRSGFGSVDDDPDGGGLVAALDEQAGLPAVRRLRSTAVRLLGPRPGATLLDAGCGTGEMSRRLAGRVAPDGAVVAIDTSATMLAEARRRTVPSLPVEYRSGDITRLDLASEIVDGAYSERVLQHVDRSAAAIAELVRVTRPGGHVVVVDTDWGMHAIHGADPWLTGRVVACWAEHTTNGWSGRQLPALFAREGLTQPAIVAGTVTSRTTPGPAMEPFDTMAMVAQQRGALTNREARRWVAQLSDAMGQGWFFWAITMFLVAGARPPA
jgi:SAM-dependent methyltransferase